MSTPITAALGVDVGTTNTKAVLAVIDSHGSVHEERIRTFPTPSDGERLRRGVLAALAEVADGAGAHAVAIGVASMAETGALVGPDGESRGDLLGWSQGDRRSADALVMSAGAAELYAVTGVPVPAKSPLARWLSLRAADDPRLQDARWQGAADLVVAALTGEAATDHTLAQRTMAYRLPGGAGAAHVETFDPDLLALAGLTPDRFPRVVAPGETAGALTREAGSRLGLPFGLPVVVAGHDHAVGAWAAGVRSPGRAADSVGTAEALYRVAADVPLERAREAGMSTGRTVDGRHASVLAGNPTAGALIEWAFAELFPGVERQGVLDRAARESRDRRPGDPAAFVLPYLRGRQAPAPDPAARMRAVPRLPVDPGDALVALFTGLSLQLAWLDAEQDRLVGPRAPVLVVLGGPGAGDDAWWNAKRHVVAGSLRRVEATEPVATGAAILAAARVAGIMTTLPSRSRESAASAGDPALLDAFVRAATHQERETA